MNWLKTQCGLWFSTFFIILVITSFHNFLLFHLGVELFSSVIAFIMFAIIVNLYDNIDNDYFIFLGLVYAFVGFFDLLHTISYEGIGVFPSATANLPTQLWVMTRYLESISLLISFYFLTHSIKALQVVYTYVGVTILLLASVFWWDIFPDCFVEGVGLTRFKIGSEYLIIGILIVALILLFRYKKHFADKMHFYMVLSIVATIISELFFTVYVDVYGISNIVGHVAKVVSFYFIYKSVVEVGLRKPYQTIFNRIAQAKDNLAQKNDELEEIISVISHDLRSPVVNISGFSKEIKLTIAKLKEELSQADVEEEIKTILEEDLKEEVEYIISSSENISNMLEGLLKVSRLNRKELNKEKINVNELLETIITDYQYQIETKRIAVEIEDLPACKADRLLLQQVFSNLIDNAIKYIKTEAAGEILITGQQEKEQVIYKVQDKGIGISKEQQEQIFDIFKQADHTKSGEGLGLALVKKIINLHQGQIWLESAAGEGTKMFFSLPLE